MAQLRAVWSRIPVLAVLIGLTLGARRHLRRADSLRRPTGDELMAMSDAEFASFIASTGIKTVTTAGLTQTKASAD